MYYARTRIVVKFSIVVCLKMYSITIITTYAINIIIIITTTSAMVNTTHCEITSLQPLITIYEYKLKRDTAERKSNIFETRSPILRR